MLKFIILIMTMIMTNCLFTVKLSLTTLLIIFNLMLQNSELSKISYIFMGDYVSYWITNLTMWIVFAMIFTKMNSMESANKITTILLLTLIMTFNIWNLLTFYVCFEMVVIIILIIMIAWGYQPERIEAIMYMIIMTLAVALPFIMAMLSNLAYLNFWFINLSLNLWEYLSLMLVFMMKMPMFFLHFWLPKVHVESPVHGSMILAAILLKLGAYGLIRVMPLTLVLNKINMSTYVSFTLWTSLVLSLICLIQTDLKTLIAYSSIVHMATMLSSILLNTNKSLMGSFCIILGHGLCSSGLFFMANYLYKNSKSRSIIINKGLMNLAPNFIMLWFLLCMNNAPMPPSLNILGEILMFKSTYNWSPHTMLMLPLIIVVSSLYSIVLFYSMSHSSFTYNLTKIISLNSKHTIVIMIHITPLMLMVIKCQILTI